MGFAQKLFIEKGGKLAARQSVCQPDWPQIQRMLAQKRLSYVDYALAESLLKDYPGIGEEVVAFICHLSTSAREGHLCLRIDKEGIFPDPSQSWREEGEAIDGTSPSAEEWQTLRDLIIRGAAQLPSALLSQVSDTFVPSTPICCFRNLFYFQRYWFYETVFLKHFQAIIQRTPTLTLNLDNACKQVSGLEQDKQLLPEQAAAILSACRNGLTVICGGPGTGKTYTAGHLIKVYWESLSLLQRQQCVIALAAPTGKAAANLQKSLSQAVASLEGFVPLQAKTLHALLGIRSNIPLRDTATKVLPADLIVVDESSMIDLNLMVCLLGSIKPGARLILLGDKHQLPPISAGSLFSDIIAYLSNTENEAIQLKTCLRAELQMIVDFADAINRGNSEEAIHYLQKGDEASGISRLQFGEEESSVRTVQESIINYVVSLFPTVKPNNDDPQSILEAFNRFRILSPLRQGPFGVDELNRLILKQQMRKMREDPLFAAPIMVVSNDYRLELFNGEVGVLVRQRVHNDKDEPVLQEGDYVLFPNKSDSNGPVRKLSALLLPKYEYAYCLSVYKSQGSEFERVLLLMPDGSERFGREALYTAATRARKKLQVWGSDAVLRSTIDRHSCRLSGVANRF